jgi:RNA-binding protein NOB1
MLKPRRRRRRKWYQRQVSFLPLLFTSGIIPGQAPLEGDLNVQELANDLKEASLDDKSVESRLESSASPEACDPDADCELPTQDIDSNEHPSQNVQNDADHDSPFDHQSTHNVIPEIEASNQPEPTSPAPLYDDPSSDDDGEGEWITPSNVALHRSRALDLLPSASGAGKNKTTTIVKVGCMTADFAMQNVLLHMGLNLVGAEGERIERLKSWVLRCHACFK